MGTKINVRSPYFIKATAETGTLNSAVMSLYIYDGILTTNKGTVKYTIEKQPCLEQIMLCLKYQNL